MGFRLKSDQTVSNEIRRIVLRQLDIATSELTAVGTPESDEAIHDARRRVKKIRAIIRLVRPVLDKTYRAVDDDLGDVSRMLAPVADGQGVIDTVNQLARRYRAVLPRRSIAAIRSDLIEREKRIDSQAASDRVLQKARTTLRAEKARVRRWRLKAEGFRAVARGLKESVRRSRDAMITAWIHPTAAHHHTWRHHVKNHWLQVRLLEGRCGNHLMPYQRKLEELDGLLGEYHNTVLLREVLMTDSVLSERETKRCLRVVARYQRTLHYHAQLLGARIYSEKPRRFVKRVRKLWNVPMQDGRTRRAGTRTS